MMNISVVIGVNVAVVPCDLVAGIGVAGNPSVDTCRISRVSISNRTLLAGRVASGAWIVGRALFSRSVVAGVSISFHSFRTGCPRPG